MSSARDAFPHFTLSEDHEAAPRGGPRRRRGQDRPVRRRGRRGGRASRRRRTTRWRAADFHAPHIPEEYGGVGADALATCIVIEEVARVGASRSLIPAVNKLGTMPLLLAASDERQAALPAAGRQRARRCSPTACPSARPARDTAAMKTRATPRRRRLGAQRPEVVDHQRRRRRATTRCSRSPTPTARAGGNITAFVVEKSDEGFTFGGAGAQARHQGQPDPRAALRRRPRSPATASSARPARA